MLIHIKMKNYVFNAHKQTKYKTYNLNTLIILNSRYKQLSIFNMFLLSHKRKLKIGNC